MYYQHFTSMQIAKHIQCLIAAKHVAHATNHLRSLEFDFHTEHNAFFLTTLGSDPAIPTESQLKTEAKIADHLGRIDILWGWLRVERRIMICGDSM